MNSLVLCEVRFWGELQPWSVLFLAALAIASSSTSSMAAEDEELLRYSGRFELVDAEASEAVRDLSVREVAAAFPAPLRKMVAGKMRKAATIFPFVELRREGASITIRSDESTGWMTGLDKREVEFRAKDGKTFFLSRWMDGEVLHTRARGETGTRAAKFQLSEGGDVLTVFTTIQLDRSEKPIVYSASYKRTQTLGK